MPSPQVIFSQVGLEVNLKHTTEPQTPNAQFKLIKLFPDVLTHSWSEDGFSIF